MFKKNKNKLDFSKAKTEVVKEKKAVVEKPKSNTGRKKLQKRMMTFMGIGLLLILLIFVISLLSSGSTNRVYSYEEVEEIMREAAMEFMRDNANRLPNEDGDMVAINAIQLINGEFMEPFDDYLGDGSGCNGHVEVTKVGEIYRFVPFLNCASGHQTMELHTKLRNIDIVENGSGLYLINGELVFRGERVDNYLLLDETLWRIVRVLETGDIVITKDELLRGSEVFDNRYNPTRGQLTGNNNYKLSRMGELLSDILTTERLELSEDTMSNLIPFSMCIGRVSGNYERKDNYLECQDQFENQLVGLLTLSDYLIASIDENCHTLQDRSCQNFNYLNNDVNAWWLATGNLDNDHQMFRVQRGVVEITSASNSARVRPVLHLSSNALFSGGDGTLENPFTIR